MAYEILNKFDRKALLKIVEEGGKLGDGRHGKIEIVNIENNPDLVEVRVEK